MTYALRSFEYWAYSYRRVWRGSVVSSIVGPILYLTALGVGLGKLVNRGPGVGVPYLDFVAPGILAATAMQLATFESSYPVMAAIRWTRQFHAMLATPLRSRDLLIGHQLYVAARLAVVSAIYLVVLAGFMKLTGEAFLGQFGGRTVNTHPALSPSFPGVHGPQEALDYGVKVTGCTLFVVDAGVDTGPIVAQRVVNVQDDDTVETLHERIKSAERQMLVDCVGRMVRDGFTISQRKVTIS